MQRSIQTVMIEALIIGIMNATLFWGLKQFNFVIPQQWLLVICGALIHLIFEYSGGMNGGVVKLINAHSR